MEHAAWKQSEENASRMTLNSNEQGDQATRGLNVQIPGETD